MKATSYTERRDKGEGVLSGYHSNGFYRMGSVIVKFWSSDDNSEVGFIELIPMMGKSYIRELRGSRI